MVSEAFRAYPSECLCWAYHATRYRAAIGPPIIYSPTHELAVSTNMNNIIIINNVINLNNNNINKGNNNFFLSTIKKNIL